MSFGARRILFCLILSAEVLWPELNSLGAGLREMWVAEKTWSPDYEPTDTKIDQAGDVLQLWGQGGGAAVIAKFSGQDGSVMWERTIDFNGWDLHLDPDGNAVLSGRNSFFGTNEMITSKFARETGASMWEKRYGNANGFPSGRWSGVDEEGNVIAFGSFLVGTNSVYRLVEYAATDGAIRWESAPDIQGLAKVKAGRNGEVVVAGVETNRLTVLKFNGDSGSLIWRSEASTNRINFLLDIGTDQNGNVAVTGEAFNREAYTAKLRGENGHLMWEQLQSSTNGSKLGTQIAVTSNGEVMEVGSVFCDETSLTKYAADDGTVVWQRVFSTERSCNALAQLFIDSAGHVFFFQDLATTDFATDCIARRLDERTGKVLWERVAPSVSMVSARYERGLLAAVGREDWAAPMRVRFYRFGPELKTRLLGAEVEIEWDPNPGSRLERSTASIGGVQDWVTVEGSSETNSVRVVTRDGAEIFRLVGE